MLGQVELLGDKYFDWTHEQVDRPIRLFESDFAEMMTKAYWWFVPTTWLPVVLVSLWMSFRALSDTQEVWPQHSLGKMCYFISFTHKSFNLTCLLFYCLFSS